MASRHDSMVNPRIEELLDRSGSKFTLVTLGATRARQINAYFNKLGDGQGGIPPQVASVGITSSNGIFSTGLKKCIPTRLSGFGTALRIGLHIPIRRPLAPLSASLAIGDRDRVGPISVYQGGRRVLVI